MTSCASFQLSTLNHDPIYNSNENIIDVNIVDSGWELDRLLRYNSTQYTFNQPFGFYYNNHFSGFNYWNGYSWGYPYGMGFTYSWNHHRWGSNYWYNPYGWNQWYGWGNGYNHNTWNQIRSNQQNMLGRRDRTTNTNRRVSSETTSTIRGINDRIRVRRTEIKPIKRNTWNPTVRSNNNRRVIRPNNTIRPNKRNIRTVTVPLRNNTTKPVNKRRQ